MAGFVMTTFGRKGATIMFTIPSYTIGYLTMANTNHLGLVVLGRFLTGLGLGFTLTIPNVYVVEITSPEYRGVLGVVPNLFCQIGIFSTYVLGQFFDWQSLAFGCKCAVVCISKKLRCIFDIFSGDILSAFPGSCN